MANATEYEWLIGILPVLFGTLRPLSVKFGWIQPVSDPGTNMRIHR